MMAYVTDGERLMEGINDEILRAELKDDVSFGSVIQYVEGQLAVKRRPARAVVPAGIIVVHPAGRARTPPGSCSCTRSIGT